VTVIPISAFACSVDHAEDVPEGEEEAEGEGENPVEKPLWHLNSSCNRPSSGEKSVPFTRYGSTRLGGGGGGGGGGGDGGGGCSTRACGCASVIGLRLGGINSGNPVVGSRSYSAFTRVLVPAVKNES